MWEKSLATIPCSATHRTAKRVVLAARGPRVPRVTHPRAPQVSDIITDASKLTPRVNSAQRARPLLSHLDDQYRHTLSHLRLETRLHHCPKVSPGGYDLQAGVVTTAHALRAAHSYPWAQAVQVACTLLGAGRGQDFHSLVHHWQGQAGLWQQSQEGKGREPSRRIGRADVAMIMRELRDVMTSLARVRDEETLTTMWETLYSVCQTSPEQTSLRSTASASRVLSLAHDEYKETKKEFGAVPCSTSKATQTDRHDVSATAQEVSIDEMGVHAYCANTTTRVTTRAEAAYNFFAPLGPTRTHRLLIVATAALCRATLFAESASVREAVVRIQRVRLLAPPRWRHARAVQHRMQSTDIDAKPHHLRSKSDGPGDYCNGSDVYPLPLVLQDVFAECVESHPDYSEVWVEECCPGLLASLVPPSRYSVMDVLTLPLYEVREALKRCRAESCAHSEARHSLTDTPNSPLSSSSNLSSSSLSLFVSTLTSPQRCRRMTTHLLPLSHELRLRECIVWLMGARVVSAASSAKGIVVSAARESKATQGGNTKSSLDAVGCVVAQTRAMVWAMLRSSQRAQRWAMSVALMRCTWLRRQLGVHADALRCIYVFSLSASTHRDHEKYTHDVLHQQQGMQEQQWCGSLSPTRARVCGRVLCRLCHAERYAEAGQLVWTHLALRSRVTQRLFAKTALVTNCAVVATVRAMRAAADAATRFTVQTTFIEPATVSHRAHAFASAAPSKRPSVRYGNRTLALPRQRATHSAMLQSMGYNSLTLLHTLAAAHAVTPMHCIPVCAAALRCGVPFAHVRVALDELCADGRAGRGLWGNAQWVRDVVRLCTETNNESRVVRWDGGGRGRALSGWARRVYAEAANETSGSAHRTHPQSTPPTHLPGTSMGTHGSRMGHRVCWTMSDAARARVDSFAPCMGYRCAHGRTTGKGSDGAGKRHTLAPGATYTADSSHLCEVMSPNRSKLLALLTLLRTRSMHPILRALLIALFLDRAIQEHILHCEDWLDRPHRRCGRRHKRPAVTTVGEMSLLPARQTQGHACTRRGCAHPSSSSHAAEVLYAWEAAASMVASCEGWLTAGDVRLSSYRALLRALDCRRMRRVCNREDGTRRSDHEKNSNRGHDIVMVCVHQSTRLCLPGQDAPRTALPAYVSPIQCIIASET